MPANFAGAEGREKFVARSARLDENGMPEKDTWHRLGEYRAAPIETIDEAFTIAKIHEIIVDKWPLLALPPAELRSLPGIAPAASNMVQLVRRPIDGDPEWRMFGTPVSSDYGVLQPPDLARILQPLADKFGGVDTAGALDQGKTIFLCFNGGEGHLPGHENERMIFYYVVADHKTGDKATWSLFSPVRVVCANTLAMAKGAAAFALKLPHRAELHADLEWTTQFMLDAHKAQEKTLAIFAQLATRVATPDEVKEVIGRAYPEPKQTQRLRIGQELGEAGGELTRDDIKARMEQWKRQCEQAERDRKQVQDLFEQENDTAPDSSVAGSLYSLVNAVAEKEQYTIGARQTALSVAKSALFGAGEKAQTRAFNAACELAGVGA